MNPNDDLTSTLSQELEERAHTMDGSTLHLTDVQGRARSIRRRRTATAVAGVAAAVAVIVPVATLASRSGGNPEPAPATQSVTPTPTGSGGHQPAPGVLDVSDLPTGDGPRMEYLENGTVLHQVDGSTVDIDTQYPVSSFVTLTDGTHLWQTLDNEGHGYVEIQDAEGTSRDPVPDSGSLSVNSAHTVGAWVRPDGQVMVWNAGATEPLAYQGPVDATDDMRMGPVLGDHCGAPEDSCEVYVNVSDPKADPSWQPWLVDVNDTAPSLDGSYLILKDATESGLVVGYRKLTDFGSCSILLGGGEFQGFDTCKHTLDSFSPDSLLLGLPAYGDGLGPNQLAMYDLSGTLLFDRKATQHAQATYQSHAWEDGKHVLISVFQDGRWSIVRVASDGSMEYAVQPVAGEDVDNPFLLATGGPTLGD